MGEFAERNIVFEENFPTVAAEKEAQAWVFGKGGNKRWQKDSSEPQGKG